MRTIREQFTAARCASCPIVAIRSLDQMATLRHLMVPLEKEAPLFRWDMVSGMAPLNVKGQAALDALMYKLATGNDVDPLKYLEEMTKMNPVETLVIARQLPKDSITVMLNMHRFLTDAPVAQALLNLRNEYKEDGRMILLLAPDFDLPVELKQDIAVMDEERLNDQQLAEVVVDVLQAAEQPPLDAPTLAQAVTLLKGFSHFTAEQTVAQAMSEQGLDIRVLRENKRQAIRQIKGITMDEDIWNFSHIGGAAQAKAFAGLYMNGPCRPHGVFRLEELEKKMAGVGGKDGGGDTSGASQDALDVFLNCMEDNKWDGMLLVGPGGSGKSLYSKAIGSEYKVPSFTIDLGASKGRYIGQSEEQIRSLLQTMVGIAGTRALIVATCNKLDTVPPELKRRFTAGIWYFDLPTHEEQVSIWDISLRQFNLSQQALPEAGSWTGAEIRNCCKMAQALGCSLVEAAQFIVPLWKSDAASIVRLRDTAHNSFLSANYPGAYHKPSASEDAPPSLTSTNKARNLRLSKVASLN